MTLTPEAAARARELGQHAPDLPEEKRQRLRSIFRRGRRARDGVVSRDLRGDHK